MSRHYLETKRLLTRNTPPHNLIIHFSHFVDSKCSILHLITAAHTPENVQRGARAGASRR